MKRSSFLKTMALGLAVTFTGAAHAEAPFDNRNNKVLVHQMISASADKVWAQVGKLDGIEHYVPKFLKKTSVSGQHAGAERICVHHDNSKIVETIIAYDDQSRSYSYTVTEGLNMPASNLYNTVQVHPVTPDSSLLVWSSKYDDSAMNKQPEMMRQRMQGILAVAAAGVKTFVESGRTL